MRLILVTFLTCIGLNVLADQKQSKLEINSFAKVKGGEHWNTYEIFVLDEYGGFYLTSVTLAKENSLLVELAFDDAFTYPNYKKAFFQVSAVSADEYDIFFSYSTAENGDLVICGGEVISTNVKKLLSANQPKEVIPTPPADGIK